jgi:hypothetical protein
MVMATGARRTIRPAPEAEVKRQCTGNIQHAATGVEHPDALKRLCELGFDAAQGRLSGLNGEDTKKTGLRKEPRLHGGRRRISP